MRFKDRIVLVTGSSRNTGLGIAASFLREGATVFVNGASPENTEAGVRELEGCGTGKAVAMPCDISRTGEVEKMFVLIREHTDRLDVLVNNAVHLGCGPSFVETPIGYIEEVFRVNLLGTLYVSQLAVRMMIPRQSGAIVHVGSNVSTRAIRNRIAYCISKGGIDAMTLAMALELAPLGIRVNSVIPGYIRTDRWDALEPGIVERRRANTPLRSEATADDIARSVLFLASDDARSICGTRLIVDGGCSAQHMPADVDF